MSNTSSLSSSYKSAAFQSGILFSYVGRHFFRNMPNIGILANETGVLSNSSDISLNILYSILSAL